MRRAAIQAARSARHSCQRRFARISPLVPGSHALGHRLASSRVHAPSALLASSMQLRAFTGALVAAAVASGAFYAYRGTVPGSPTSAADQARAFSSSSGQPEVPRERRALVVDQNSLYTGTIQGDGPLKKETDDSGRKVLEMLTPEQATQKLRKNEESWLVGRGQGVVRYDVVQIPSNDPIEDDHAEKIIEVPSNLTASDKVATPSDWMFWGVFDGHR